MIWQLAREQIRSQKRFIAWTGGMLVAVLTLATYSAVMSTTEQANNRVITEITGASDLHQTWAWSYPGGSQDAGESAEGGNASVAEVDAAIEAAVRNGSDLQATRNTDMFVVDPDDLGSALVAMTGDVDWDSLILTGVPPAAGQVAISGRIANQLDVGIGDSLDAVGDYISVDNGGSGDFVPERVSLTVSGITRSPVTRQSDSSRLREAFASWDDSVALAIAGGTLGNGGGTDVSIFTDVSWNTGTPDPRVFSMQDEYSTMSTDSVSSATALAGYLTWVLAIGLLVMAVAIGRTQAQARVSWVGTARALGARRRTIIHATALETLVIGLAAAGIGGTVGLAAASINQAIVRSSVPDPFYPSAPVIAPWLLPALVALGIGLAAVVGAVPAFWASRIEPVSALKPLDADVERSGSRGRWGTVALYSWIAAIIALVTISLLPALVGGLDWLSTLLMALVVLLSVAMSYRVLRVIVRRVGVRLSGSSRVWAIASGDAWQARPAQAAVPALLYAVILTPTTLMTALVLRQDVFDYLPAGDQGLGVGLWAIAFAFSIVALVIATIVTLAVFFSGLRLTRADTATRTALGMSRADERKARFAQFWLSLAVGSVFASVVGITIAIIMWVVDFITNPTFVNHFGGLGALVAPLIGIMALHAVALALAACGGALVAATTSRKTPVQELAHA